MKKIIFFLLLSLPIPLLAGQPIISTTNFPSAAQDSAVGIPVWVTPTNVEIEDNIVSTNSAGTGSYIETTQYGFSIPANSIILGIQADVRKRQTSSGVIDQSVRLIQPNGAYTLIEHANASEWPSSLSYVSYGSNNDLWGRNWSPTDINSSGFGFALQSNNGVVAQIDAIRITIFYVPLSHTIWNGTIKSGVLQ